MEHDRLKINITHVALKSLQSKNQWSMTFDQSNYLSSALWWLALQIQTVEISEAWQQTDPIIHVA